jgi:type I restriction enzyme M protein
MAIASTFPIGTRVSCAAYTQGHVLTPGRYVGTAATEGDDEPFADKVARLTATLRAQMAEGARLDERIRQTLAGVGHGW